MAVSSLAPATLYKQSPDATYSADDTGAWADVTVATLNSEDDGDFIYAKLGTSAGWSTRHWFAAFELTAPPLLSVVKNVTARVLLDSYSANSLAVDLSLELFLVIGGTRYLSDPIPIEGSTPTTGRRFREFEATWSLNPANGLAFGVADLQPAVIYGGFRFRCATDPAGASINLAETGACCQEFELEVEGPAAANVEVVRHVLSSHLLRHVEMGRTLTIDVAMQYGDVGILKPIWFASKDHPSSDGLGSGPEVGRRAPYVVLQKTPRLMQRQWRLKLLDPRPYSCSYWSPMVTDITADAQDTGIARLDMGGGWSVTRAQAGYVRRPPEGLWTDRPVNTPRYHKDYGLLICGGGQRWSANNTFSQGSGLNYTGWSFVASSGAQRTEELFELLFDVEGIRRGVKLHDGYRAGNADVPIYAAYTWADIAADTKVRGFMKYRPDYFGPSRPKWMLVRNGSSYWVPGSGWSGTPTWNAPDQFGEAGVGPGIRNPSDTFAELPGPVWEEFWTEEIDVGGSPCALQWRCGYSAHVSGIPSPGPQTTIFGASGLVESNGNAHCFPREFLVTTANAAEQAADDVEINNDADYRVWDVDRGTVHFDVTWGWRHADLADGDIKFLISCLHRTTDAVRHDRLYYERVDSATGRLVFRRDDASGITYDASFELIGDDLPEYLRTDKIALRWTSDLEELGLEPNTHSIFFNRVKGTDGQVTDTLPTQLDGETKVMPGRAEGCSDDEYADCYAKNFKVRTWPLSDAELLRALDY